METNVLYYGDNLDILRKYIPNNSIDLIYLDPPFNSKATYNVLFKEPTGELSQAQITAFEDTWHWTEEAARTFQEIADTAPARVVGMMVTFRSFIGRNDMMAYLTMMCIRLLELRRVLKDTGSIYLHCDTTASHYLKVVMDTMFGVDNFMNEVIWFKNSGGIGRTSFSRRHDSLLVYHKTRSHFYDGKAVGDLREQREGTFGGYFGVDEDGRKFREVRKFGKVYRYPMDEPKNPDDVWPVPQIPERDKTERLPYPTQKPRKLLERIIKASAPKDGIVLDPFCGCGTALVVASKLNRRWIGIDITHLAISTIKWSLEKVCPGIQYKVIGEPKDIAGAKELASQNKYQFQWWALSLIGARPYGDKKRGADTGIDGYLYFMDEKDKVKKAIVQVKGGTTSVKDIRDLNGVVVREKAEMGIFITLELPTKPMETEALSQGYYRSPSGKDYPKMQILTIEELLKGKKPETPSWVSPIQTPPKAKQDEGKTIKIL